MRSVTLLALALSAALLAMAAANSQERGYTVNVSATPPECVTAVLGSGTYREGSQATIEVRAAVECRFVKWRLSGGGLPEEVAANPFTFYVFGDVNATAVLEKLYRDNGTVIERFYVAFTSNVTSNALTLPGPRIVRVGELVEFNAPAEFLDGDYKYVFLHWSGPEGLRIETPSAAVAVNRSMVLVASYYTFKKFLDDYYPIHVFITPSYRDIETPDGGVERAVALRVLGYNTTLPLQPIPEPLLNIVEPVYEKYYPYSVAADAPGPVTITVNGQPIEVGSAVKLLGKAGSTVIVEAPSKTERLKLKQVEVNGRPVPAMGGESELVMTPLTSPTTIMLRYSVIPYSFMLDIPLAGTALYRLTEAGYAITALFTDAEIPYYLALALPIALVAAPGAAAAYVVRREALKGLGGSIKHSIKAAGSGIALRRRIAPLVEETGRGAPVTIIDTRATTVEGVFKAPEKVLEKVAVGAEVAEVDGVEAGPEEAEQAGDELLEELERLRAAVAEESGGKFKSSLLQLVEFDERYFQQIQTGVLKLESDGTPAVYSLEITKLVNRISATQTGLVTVSGGDRLLRERAVEIALSRAGRKWVRAPPDLMLPPDQAGMEQALKKAVKGADTLVMERPASRALAQSAIKLRILVVALLEKGGDVELPPVSDRLLPGMAAWLLLETNALKRLSYEEFTDLVETARMFRGLETVKTFANLLEDGLAPAEALDELWSAEFRETFPGFEGNIARRILKGGLSYAEARDLYLTAYRQVMAGGDPQTSWARFVAKLEKLGVRVE